MTWETIETRLGAFTLLAHDGHVVRIGLPGSLPETVLTGPHVPREAREHDPRDLPVLHAAAKQLREYANGQRTDLDFPVRAQGTEFQQDVWSALRRIPAGETRTYKDIAEAVGRPGAFRAVGQANRANPLPLIVPCHRVVAADGSLGGYMGDWNAEDSLKERFLELEGAGKALLASGVTPP